MDSDILISALNSKSDWTAVSECFERNGWSRSTSAIEWQYPESPTGKVYVDIATREDTIAAIYASLPQRFQCFGQECVSIQSLDTLTDESYRGQGLFKRLAKGLYNRVEDEDVRLVYGFPNALSAPGFFGSLGWTNMDPLPFLIRPIRPAFFFEKLKNLPIKVPDIPQLPLRERFEIREVLPTELPADTIWSGFRQSFSAGLIRDAKYLNWRFSKPGQKYRAFVALRDGQIEGFVVINTMSKHGGTIGYIVELMTGNPGQDEEMAHELLNHTIGVFRSAGCDAVLAWHFAHSPYYLPFLAAGFLPLPERLRPIELHFGALSFGGCPLPPREDWYLSYCDSDTV